MKSIIGVAGRLDNSGYHPVVQWSVPLVRAWFFPTRTDIHSNGRRTKLGKSQFVAQLGHKLGPPVQRLISHLETAVSIVVESLCEASRNVWCIRWSHSL